MRTRVAEGSFVVRLDIDKDRTESKRLGVVHDPDGKISKALPAVSAIQEPVASSREKLWSQPPPQYQACRNPAWYPKSVAAQRVDKVPPSLVQYCLVDGELKTAQGKVPRRKHGADGKGIVVGRRRDARRRWLDRCQLSPRVGLAAS